MNLSINSNIRLGDEVRRIVPPSGNFPASVHIGTVTGLDACTLVVDFYTGTSGRFQGYYDRNTGVDVNDDSVFIIPEKMAQ